MNQILPILRTELDGSQAEVREAENDVLRAQERLKVRMAKRDQIAALITTYETEARLRAEGPQPQAALPLPTTAQQQSTPVQVPSHPPPIPHSGSKKSRMIQEIDGLLTLHATVHRKHMLDHLTSLGIMGQEKNPLNALGIFLTTHRDRYKADGSGNYSLRRQEARASEAMGTITFSADGATILTTRGPSVHDSPRGEAGGVAPPVPA